MAVIETKAEVVFVATDKNPMMSTIEEKLSDYNVGIFCYTSLISAFTHSW